MANPHAPSLQAMDLTPVRQEVTNANHAQDLDLTYVTQERVNQLRAHLAGIPDDELRLHLMANRPEGNRIRVACFDIHGREQRWPPNPPAPMVPPPVEFLPQRAPVPFPPIPLPVQREMQREGQREAEHNLTVARQLKKDPPQQPPDAGSYGCDQVGNPRFHGQANGPDHSIAVARHNGAAAPQYLHQRHDPGPQQVAMEVEQQPPDANSHSNVSNPPYYPHSNSGPARPNGPTHPLPVAEPVVQQPLPNPPPFARVPSLLAPAVPFNGVLRQQQLGMMVQPQLSEVNSYGNASNPQYYGPPNGLTHPKAVIESIEPAAPQLPPQRQASQQRAAPAQRQPPHANNQGNGDGNLSSTPYRTLKHRRSRVPIGSADPQHSRQRHISAPGGPSLYHLSPETERSVQRWRQQRRVVTDPTSIPRPVRTPPLPPPRSSYTAQAPLAQGRGSFAPQGPFAQGSDPFALQAPLLPPPLQQTPFSGQLPQGLVGQDGGILQTHHGGGLSNAQPQQELSVQYNTKLNHMPGADPIGSAVDLVQAIIAGTFDHELTVAELERHAFTRPDLRRAFVLLVDQGIFGDHGWGDSESDEVLQGTWTRFRGMDVIADETLPMDNNALHVMLVECYRDLKALRSTLEA